MTGSAHIKHGASGLLVLDLMQGKHGELLICSDFASRFAPCHVMDARRYLCNVSFKPVLSMLCRELAAQLEVPEVAIQDIYLGFTQPVRRYFQYLHSNDATSTVELAHATAVSLRSLLQVSN